MKDCVITGNFVDIEEKKIYKMDIEVVQGVINSLNCYNAPEEGLDFIMPGFIDAHVHIESSMLMPSQFARMAVRHGVTTVVTDPHEIANVLGEEGVDFMIEDSKKVRFNFLFGAPSCVPATPFETSGAVLDSAAVENLLERKDIGFLSEMMNYPGVLAGDTEVMAKIEAAKKHGKPIDGHAPGLTGEGLDKYAKAGISTEHECTTIEEAEEKMRHGINILIREGSAAKNFDALWPLIDKHPKAVMMCSDDKHPDELETEYINTMCIRALKNGCDMWNVLRASYKNASNHYKLKLLSPISMVGMPPEFIVVDKGWNVKKTYIDGEKVYDSETDITDEFYRSNSREIYKYLPNVMYHGKITAKDIKVKACGETARVRVMVAESGQLLTKSETETLEAKNGEVQCSTEKDVLKIVVVNRYDADAKPAVAYVKGFGLKKGAIGSTIAHDCHNIICVGTDDESIVKAVNRLVEMKGGIVTYDGEKTTELPLPLAGLMSDKQGEEVAEAYRQLNAKAKELGTTLHAPFMTLSFMALLVIPELKISDKGLFDGTKFSFTNLVVE